VKEGLRLFASVVAFALVVGASGTAWAAACCGDGGSLGQRLTRDERAALTVGPTWIARFGGWGSRGEYAGLARGDHDHTLRLDASWIVRPTSRLEVGVTVPVQVVFRALGGASDLGGGFGDVSALARFTVIAVDDTTPWPALFVTSTVVVPTGRPTQLGSGLGADVTGQGVAELRTGLSLEKAWRDRWFAQASGSVGLFGPSDAGGILVARRPRWTTGFVTGPVVPLRSPMGLAFGAGVTYEVEPAASVAGVVSGTARSKVSLVTSGALDLTGRLGLVASVKTALPAPHAGQNDTAGVEVSAAFRFATRLVD
jgi:hypothetical protein